MTSDVVYIERVVLVGLEPSDDALQWRAAVQEHLEREFATNGTPTHVRTSGHLERLAGISIEGRPDRYVGAAEVGAAIWRSLDGGGAQ